MNRFPKISSLFALIFVLFSCTEDTQKATVKDLSDYARNYLKMNLSGASQNSMALSNQGNPVNASFQRLFNSANGFSGGRLAEDSASVPPSDTTIINDPWVSCATVTTTLNKDGSQTTMYDYGDGCEEGYPGYKYLMFGKYSSTFRNSAEHVGSLYKESYLYKWLAENYGGRYYYNNDTTEWHSNGSSDYSGESQYDTAKQTYSGNYTYSADNEYAWDSIQYLYKGHGKTSYTEKQFVIESSVYEYTYNGDYYKTEVIEPLVSRYDCNGGGISYCRMFFTYVSGREFIRYKQDGKEGSFEINYGDGTCDNIVVVTENGKSIEVDLGNRIVAY